MNDEDIRDCILKHYYALEEEKKEGEKEKEEEERQHDEVF